MRPHIPSFSRLLVVGVAAVILCAFIAQDADEAPPAPAVPRWQPVAVLQLAVADVDRSVAFYRDVLGMTLTRRMASPPWAELATAVPGLSIGLGQESAASGSGSSSLNLAVSDADATRALLESRGVTFDGPTIEIPGIVRLADFRDPDGNRLRLAGPAPR